MRPAARFGLAALAGGLFYGIEKAIISQWLGLLQRQSDIGDGVVGQCLVKKFAVGCLMRERRGMKE